MPFNLAVLNPNVATSIIDSHPEIKHWIISGHSMGGAMASSYASQYSDKVDGLILLGAYIYGDYPQEKALTIYGSLNTSVQEKIDYTENIIVIEGGNHAQFGNYGSQKGDAVAQISQLDQQEIAISAMVEFIGDLK
jgi:pimeloyl-ACP methyl ester carboxylesterase